MPDLLSLDAAAAQLPLPASTNRARTLRRLIRDKRVPFVKVGRGVFLTQAQFDLLFERLTCSPSDSAENTGTSGVRYGPRVRRKSASLRTLQELGGWLDLNQVQRYAAVDFDDAARKIALVS